MPPSGRTLEGESRILATPHIGAATREAQPRIAKYVARTTELLSRYGMIRNCVFRPRASIQFEVPKQGCLVSVVHADKRGTKKAVDDAIYEAGANNLRSAHIDFPEYGVAYEVSALDRALSPDDVATIAPRGDDHGGRPSDPPGANHPAGLGLPAPVEHD